MGPANKSPPKPIVITDRKPKVAIIGSGNIGKDLMGKMLRHGNRVDMGVLVGIDSAYDGLARAARTEMESTHEGVEGLARLPAFKDIDTVFEATSASTPVKNYWCPRANKPSMRFIDHFPFVMRWPASTSCRPIRAATSTIWKPCLVRPLASRPSPGRRESE